MVFISWESMYRLAASCTAAQADRPSDQGRRIDTYTSPDTQDPNPNGIAINHRIAESWIGRSVPPLITSRSQSQPPPPLPSTQILEHGGRRGNLRIRKLRSMTLSRILTSYISLPEPSRLAGEVTVTLLPSIRRLCESVERKQLSIRGDSVRRRLPPLGRSPPPPPPHITRR